MFELLGTILNFAIPVFAAGSMITVGFRYSVSEVVEPLRDVIGVITALVANFVLVPLLAYGILQVLPLESPYAVGLILVSTAAGAPLLIKLSENADEDVSFAAAILVLLVVVTMLFMPLVVPMLTDEGAVSAWAIARPLVLTMLLPLIGAFIFRMIWPNAAKRVLPWVGMAVNVALWTMVALTVVINLEAVRSVFGTGAILASLVLVVGAYAIGYLVGTFDKREKVVLGFATAQRNFAAAIVVATLGFADQRVLVMAVVVSVVAMILLPFSSWLGTRKGKPAETVNA